MHDDDYIGILKWIAEKKVREEGHHTRSVLRRRGDQRPCLQIGIVDKAVLFIAPMLMTGRDLMLVGYVHCKNT